MLIATDRHEKWCVVREKWLGVRMECGSDQNGSSGEEMDRITV